MIGQDWQYQFLASSPCGAQLFYSLDPGSVDAGLQIGALTGVMTWNPQIEASLSPVVTVSDDRNNIVQSQAYSLSSVPSATNTPPSFDPDAPAPSGPAVVGMPFTYQAVATDPDGDKLEYSVDTAGVSIDADTGLLTWTPTVAASDMTITVSVTDHRSPAVTKDITLSVIDGPTNHAPQFTSTSAPTPTVGYAYQAQIVATDGDGDPIAYYLSGAPEGMTINRDTGLISWIPTSADPVTFQVFAEDGRGGVTTLPNPITLTPNASFPSYDPPVFDTATLNGPAVARSLWQQKILAHDPNGSPLTFSLDVGSPDGMKIDPITGVLTWTPGADQADFMPGFPSANFTVTVIDDIGFSSTSPSYAVGVISGQTNQPPAIQRNARTEIQVGRNYVYLPQASDADGDPLTWTLVNTVTSAARRGAARPGHSRHDNSRSTEPASRHGHLL